MSTFRAYFNEKLIPVRIRIPYVPNQSYITKYTSGKLLFTFVIMFSFFCKYLYILSLFIAPFIKKKKISHTLLTEMQEQNENAKLFLRKIYYEISCYILPLFTLLYKICGLCTNYNPWKGKKQQKNMTLSLELLRPCAIHKNFYWEKTAVSQTVWVPGFNNKWCLAFTQHMLST